MALGGASQIMAVRGARSDQGNVRGALVDEFTHVITGGTTRNYVLKQSSTLLGRCSVLCQRQETGRRFRPDDRFNSGRGGVRVAGGLDRADGRQGLPDVGRARQGWQRLL